MGAPSLPPSAARTDPSHSAFSWLKYLRPLGDWLSARPLLLLEAALLGLMVWGGVGKELGIPLLFWHENALPQFIAGFCVADVMGILCIAGCLLAAREPWLLRPPTPGWLEKLRVPSWVTAYFRPLPGSLRWYLLLTWPVALGALALRAFVAADGDDSFSENFNAVSKWPFLVGIVVGPLVLLTVLIGAIRWQSPRRVERVQKSWKMETASHETVALQRLANLVFCGLGLVFVVLYFAPWLVEHVFPAVVLCYVFVFIAAAYGALKFWLPWAGVPAALLLVLWVGWHNRNGEGLQFPDLVDYYELNKTVALESFQKQMDGAAPASDARLLQNEQVLDAWLAEHKKRHPRATQPKLLVVTVTGGGIRAAVWATVVLTELERRTPGMSYDIRLITGASGGMVGAAHFTASLDELQKLPVQPDDLQRTQFLDTLVDRMASDALRPVASRWIFHDVPHLVGLAGAGDDRGQALERAWSVNQNGAMDIPFRKPPGSKDALPNLRDGEEAGWRPSLVFAPMLVEDGRRLLISNLDLSRLAQYSGPAFVDRDNTRPANTTADQLYSRSAVEFFRLFPNADQFKLCTAARMSASFAYVSPAVALPTEPPRRVVDAGYYDYYGVNIAVAWLNELRPWFEKHHCDVELIQVRDVQLGEGLRRYDLPDQRSGMPLDHAFEELTTPLQALFSARQSSMAYRNDQQLELVSKLFNERRPGSLAISLFECPTHASMSWHLTSLEIDKMRYCVKPRAHADVVATPPPPAAAPAPTATIFADPKIQRDIMKSKVERVRAKNDAVLDRLSKNP
jgi:hypothetical protein